MRQTSLEAYEAIKRSGLLRGLFVAVYGVLYEHGPLTAGETAKRIPGHQLNSISPRFAELQRRGVIQPVGTRLCTVTGQNAIIWDVTANLPAKATMPPARPEALRQTVTALRNQVQTLQTVIKQQKAQLARWGRPSNAYRANRDPATLTLPLQEIR